MKRFTALLLGMVMLLGLFAGCNNTATTTAPPSGTSTTAPTTTAPTTPPTTEPPAEKVFIVRATSDPVTFNPNGTSDDAAFAMVGNVYSKLVTLDATRQIIPELATDWETSADGLSITFHLVKNATFHDGEPVTAEDVAYTFNYIITVDTCLMYNRFSAQIESVEATDEYTVVFHLKQPYAALIGYLGYYATFIMPKHIYDNGQTWDENPAINKPIGSGPFKFVEHKPGEYIELAKNENYFKTEVKLDRLVFRQIPDAATAFQSLLNGEIDYMGAIPDANVAQLMNDPNFTLNMNVLPSPTYILFNFAKTDILTLPVRQAIACAIDRDEISKKVFNNIREPEYNFYPSIIEWASNSDAPAPKYNIEEAVRILEEAGYKKDADGFYVRGITLDCFSTDSSPDIAKLMKATCELAGIELEIIVSEYQAYSTKVGTDKNFMIAMQGGFQGPDPTALSGRIGVGGGQNHGLYANDEIESLFAEAMKTTDEVTRKPMFYRIQEIMQAELPLIPIVKYSTYVAQRSDAINTPIQSAGFAGWVEYAFTDFK